MFKFLNPKWIIDTFFTLGFGGSSSPAPTNTTVQNTNIPDYAQPYVENMLNATQQQLFNMDSSGNITGFNQYQPYSTNAANYVAGFSPLQQQAQQSAAALQTPGQIGAGSQLAGAAGMGALTAAGQAGNLMGQALGYGQQGAGMGSMGAMNAQRQANMASRQAGMYGGQSANVGMQGLGYGQLGAGYGAQAAGLAPQAQGYGAMGAGVGMQGLGYGQAAQRAGQMGMQAGLGYGQQATNPAAVQAYMNPYIQASLAPQLAELGRQGQLNAQQAASQATAAGAFGGTRGQLAQAEAQRNAMMAQQNLIGQGYNNAYNQALQNMQFGANLGLQGQQAALSGYGQAGQAASTLGQLGQAQLNAQQGIIGTQANQGATQQQQQQNVINQAIQNYATAQQYPIMQLGTMMDLVRGTPTQTTSTQTYQAPPSMMSQLGGLGATALGAYGAAGGFKSNKAGGAIKEKTYASGGLVDLAIEKAMKG